MTVVHVMRSDPRNLEGVYHFSLSYEPRGSPGDRGWSGSSLKVDGLTKGDVVRMLIDIAKRIESGEPYEGIIAP